MTDRVSSAEHPSLAQRIVTAPRLSDAALAGLRVNAWLEELDPTERSEVGDEMRASPRLETVLHCIAEHSPFLWDLVSRDTQRLLQLLRSDPDRHFERVLAEASAGVAQTHDLEAAMRLLRRMKSEAALLIALADIGGAWPVMRAAAALSDLADTAVRSAVQFALAEAARAGRIQPVDPADPQKGSGYIVLAMGKLGGRELNYSSDIDLIVFFDGASRIIPENADAAPVFVRMTQRVVKLLQERTGDGYVFRPDLRLRPDPASTAVAISTAAAMVYYESVGQNWERAAMIKARACAGDIPAGEKLMADLAPFVWRKYLDYVALADVHAMKQQINAYRGHGEIAVEGHNIKLGRGGIREVEFFAQTQQLIAGGRNPALRDRDTLTTLGKLERDGWIDAAARDDLSAAYKFLRRVEHRLQMINDEQTQTLPAQRGELERFAHFLGYENRDAFAAELVAQLQTVQGYYARLFEKAPGPDKPTLLFPPDRDDHRTLDRLVELGFTQALEASGMIRNWLAGNHRSLRGAVAQENLKALLPDLIEHIARTANSNGTLVLFDDFLANLHAAPRLLSLLHQRPDLISLIMLVLGIAPRLADTLARNPEVMDALIDPSFFGTLPDESELRRRLEATLAQSRNDEDLLERIRMFGLEYMFLIGVRILTGTVTARQAGEAYARLADAIIRAVHRAAAENFSATYGHLADEQSAVLAMGKLGGYEMTATSDLDLILVYDFDAERPESAGKRPLHAAQYFARLTQRLINALTAQMNYGALYQVDMRLRPSGRAGPLATQIGSFASYQETEAWTWEHMALTRARVVSASPGFGERVDAAIRDVLRRRRNADLVAGDVVEMRSAVAKEHGDADRWDIKHAAGGLVDIEFIAQYLQLVHAYRHASILDTSTARVLEKARDLRILPPEDADVLRPAVRLYHDLTQVLRLCLPGAFDPKTAAPGLLQLLARAGDVPDFATLEATLADMQTRVRASFVRILGKAP
jgi:[glutamine synthetase] adenylyltransferase / [glutamine synthetase]-adenylyl-L-tyrosine phosphorylase